MRDIKEKKSKLDVEEKRLSLIISNQEFQLRILHNALLVSRGVPKDVATLRKTIIDRIRQSQRKDILISRKDELEKEIPERKKQLQKLCKHPFIIGRVGHDSYDHGETSFVPGYRWCVVCGFGEQATDTVVHADGPWYEREDKFPILNENSDRVVERPTPNPRNPLDIWQPLEEVLKHFVDKRVYEIIKVLR